MIPWFGVVDAYGGFTPEFYNAFGFFILSKSKVRVLSSGNLLTKCHQSGAC